MTMPSEGAADLATARDVRQLAVLRTTFPGWEIQRIVQGADEEAWTAELRRHVSEDMRAGGIFERLERPDAVSLASALAHQVSLLHDRRARVWPD